ncbi:short-chain dehydrogenase/reductase family 16C member 6 isoform X1 [Dendroctonus ponderosae]|uniref:Short-chain dehydrogenase/reductase 3 n=1 Tax=Dendroctonus ponderosae TaxID=77166 RepID=J3JV16_DENPD|nr:short-chain dehydrogenase/reductase family 16C member 6 isoform X1 [Dendroctonus ponderosae]AEE62044.1 unknown [Dendroctonus ponderosae]
MSSTTPELKTSHINVLKHNAFCLGGKALDITCMLVQVILFLCKLIYYWIEVFYMKINPPRPQSVSGEIILITGAGHGIGRELALVYSAKGATVVGWDINKTACDETIRRIASFRGRPKAFSFQCDITNRVEVLHVAKEVEAKVGQVTILVNNAGIMPCHLLNQHTCKEIESVFAVNLISHFWLLEAFLPGMKQTNRGHIVSLSSMAGLIGCANLVPYCASKFAVRGYMESLSDELRFTNTNNKIKLTCVYPYMVDTGLCKKPRIKYEKVMPLLSPMDVAQEIYNAQTNGKREITIPGYLNGLVQLGRLLPYRAAIALKDTFDTFVESDL